MTLFEEQSRDQRRVAWLHDFWQDVTFGARMLRKGRGFAAIAALSLALGIGGNSAVLAVLDALETNGLPFPDADRVMAIRTYPLDHPERNNPSTAPEYFAWKNGSRAFESIGASLPEQKDLGAERDGASAERLAGVAITPDLFRALGVRPLVGRLFTDDEARIGAPAPVVVISHRLWQRHFGADPNTFNAQVRLDGVTTTIIGVMPPAFRYQSDNIEFWAPLALNPRQLQNSGRLLTVAARLKPGVTVAEAQADVAALDLQLGRDFPDHQGWSTRVEPLRDALLGWTRPRLLALQAAVVLVLLIACANVAGLLLARGSTRRAEIAVRMALGAGRGRIIRQLLTEGLLLSLIGGILGVVVAWWALAALVRMPPPPGGLRIGEVPLNARTLLATAALSVITGLLFGAAPALAAFRVNLTGSLNEPVKGTGTHSGGQRTRGGLVAAQLAIALMLLIGTGLMIRSFQRLSGRELNLRPEGILSFELRLPARQYPQPLPTMTRVYERLRGLPGAESVAGISYRPVNSLFVPTQTIRVDGRPAPSTEAERTAASARYFLVTPNFFATVRAPLVRGREFGPEDTAAALWGAIVNETAARRFWPGEDPIGKRFTLDGVSGERPREVIGLVRDIPRRAAFFDLDPVIYTSFLQQSPDYRGPSPNMFGQMTFLLRHPVDPMTLAPAARRAVAEIDPDRALAAVTPLATFTVFEVVSRTTAAEVLGLFALTATLLAAIGIYGVMAFWVAQRTREIGIRMALGASARQVVSLVGRRVLLLISMGVVAGLAGALAFTRLIASQLWGVTPTDPATFAAVSLFLVLVALLASFVPLRRAIAVDPTVALRYE